jgi:hypothetical protein
LRHPLVDQTKDRLLKDQQMRGAINAWASAKSKTTTPGIVERVEDKEGRWQ